MPRGTAALAVVTHRSADPFTASLSRFVRPPRCRPRWPEQEHVPSGDPSQSCLFSGSSQLKHDDTLRRISMGTGHDHVPDHAARVSLRDPVGRRAHQARSTRVVHRRQLRRRPGRHSPGRRGDGGEVRPPGDPAAKDRATSDALDAARAAREVLCRVAPGAARGPEGSARGRIRSSSPATARRSPGPRRSTCSVPWS